jgi:hypothetical protein
VILNRQENGATNWRDMDAWFMSGRFAALLGTLIFLTFFNIFTGQETFFHRDYGVFTYPVAEYCRECFWRGEVPLWNPLNYCGIPFLAQWNTSVLYPPSLFYLVFPLSWSLGVFNVAHLFLAGMGMYFLARRWLGNNFAASVAGLCFAFNGLSWHMLMWVSNLAAWAWMPWVVLCVERAWREGGKQIAAAALAGAMQMLSGAPEIILMTWLFCGALWIGQLFQGNVSRGALLRRFLAAGMLTGGLSMAQLLPFMDLLKHSHRDTSFGDSGWAMPAYGLANFIEPLFHCFNGGHGVFVQYDQYWTASYYLGIGTLLLALVAVWRVRTPRVWLLAAAAAGSVLMALGKYGLIYSIIKAVLPQLGFMRYPIKFVVLTAFAVPLLAGCAVRWTQDSGTGSNKTQKTFLTVAAILLALLGAILWRGWSHPMVEDDWPATWQNAAVRVVFLVLVPGTLIAMRRAGEQKLQLLLRVALLLLLWTDIFTAAPDENPKVDRSVYEPGMIRKYLKLDSYPHGDEPRIMQTAAAANKVRFTSLSKPEDDYLCRRLSLYDNCNLLDNVPKIDGFYSLYLRQMDEILGLIYGYDARNIDLKGLKDFLGVAYINAADSSGEKALEWVARTNYLPLVTAGQKPFFFADTNALAYLTATNFDPRQMVFLPLEARSRVFATNRVDAKITSSQLRAQKLTMEVTAAAPALVVVAQGFYHPWRAYVDGQPTELFRANYAFQALQVPAGRHQVNLVYEDNAFRLGVAISFCSLVICAVVWLRARKKPAL